jgi:putative transposase
VQYRRSQQAGSCYFFTLVTYQRQNILLLPDNIERLRVAFKREREKYPFTLDAIVILPDHLHALWRMPEGDKDYSARWSRIKRYFSTACVGVARKPSASRSGKREKAVWQRRFWEHTIRDENDWRMHMDYIHYNPVKHNYAEVPEKWPYSSFKRCVRRGWYAPGWGATEPESIKSMRNVE